jgi:hypothetical protein
MKDAPEIYADRIKHIYKILSDPSHVSNPWYATKFIPGQARPMEEYMNQEFNATLRKFAEKYASDPKPIVKKATLP